MTDESATPVSVPVAAGTHLRRGVSTKGVDNLIATLAAGNYPSNGQCAGEEVTLPGGAKNYWWVRITANGQTGWVSATTVEVGGNDAPIPNVAQVPTQNN